MIDIKIIREKPRLVEENLRKRLKDETIVKEFLKVDNNWRVIKKETDELKARRNFISKEINKAKKSNSPNMAALLKEAKEIPGEIGKKDSMLNSLEEMKLSIWKKLPNLIDKSVPVGDASKNKV